MRNAESRRNLRITITCAVGEVDLAGSRACGVEDRLDVAQTLLGLQAVFRRGLGGDERRERVHLLERYFPLQVRPIASMLIDR